MNFRKFISDRRHPENLTNFNYVWCYDKANVRVNVRNDHEKWGSVGKPWIHNKYDLWHLKKTLKLLTSTLDPQLSTCEARPSTKRKVTRFVGRAAITLYGCLQSTAVNSKHKPWISLLSKIEPGCFKLSGCKKPRRDKTLGVMKP